MDTLTKAKAQLILDQPFFASLLLSMPMREEKGIPTLATDGDSILYNPDFISGLSLQETIFALGHEVMHCVFQHMHRRGNRNHNKYNIAADYVINDILVNEKVGTMIQGCLYNPSLVQKGNGTTEGVYDLLPDSCEKKNAGSEGGSLDSVLDSSQDEATKAQKESEMKVRIVQAANAAKMAGKLSAGLERMVKSFTRPKTDWRYVLRRFLTERARVDLTYAKPKRRFLAEDMYLPSLSGEKLGEIVVAVDCSGSVSNELLEKFSNEIKAISEDTRPTELHIVYFDHAVLKHDTYESDQEIQINPVGGGGTAFSPIFKHVSEKGILPSALVVLTDLECSDFGDAPEYPVLWASTSDRDTVPFGDVTFLKG